jgi:hypothetical protein
MRPYIQELIKDIEDIINHCGNSYSFDNWLNQMPSSTLFGNPKKLEEITGMPKDALPPEEQLNNKEKAQLSKSLEKLLETFHFIADFPEKVPSEERYKHLRSVWNSQQVYLGMGENHIEFCEYDNNTCPFPKYCDLCNEIKEQERLYNKIHNKQ